MNHQADPFSCRWNISANAVVSKDPVSMTLALQSYSRRKPALPQPFCCTYFNRVPDLVCTYSKHILLAQNRQGRRSSAPISSTPFEFWLISQSFSRLFSESAKHLIDPVQHHPKQRTLHSNLLPTFTSYLR